MYDYVAEASTMKVMLPNVIEIPVGHGFLQSQLVKFVEEDVHFEFGRQVAQATVAEGFP